MLRLHEVRFRWAGRSGFSVSVPDLQVMPGETVLLLGESGSGKSTLLSLICGTVLADSGRVEVYGQDIAALSGGAHDRFRAERIGMIFQQFNLLPFGSVLDNILLPIRFAPERRARAGDARAEAVELCHALGLPAGITSAKAATLSVGQQQRVAVARALIGRPPIVIADEPTSALDAGTQTAFLDLLFAQVRGHGTTLLMVSHDPRLADRFDRVLHMQDIAQIARQAA
ncbi:ABC transporter ATP-binding protein [Roseobacter sinensis]|uniref:ABC transporter ATP-binding protein n=1 Tax=Roseobacter sinensis TaxID=2931391 RepID=A0ABT3BCJ1_9RHOB|nr:ABC transporter ATP-binding protein [Roseobacter sp. WL0113]MCV3271294.1 ABC transporter ATP-binding protein [Roseobacter sp. WL0113]